MKKSHRKIHLVLWMVLTPLLFFTLIKAVQGIVDAQPATAIQAGKQGVVLP